VTAPRHPHGAREDGELATYRRFRDRLLLGLAAAVVAMMAYFVHQNQLQVDRLDAALAELTKRLTADQNASTGQSSRFGAQGEEALRRLDGIDKKLDAMAAAKR
jgi:hypothetical protein